ncbi:MAG TPA: heme-binding protein [Dokdonella sp.]
MNRVASIPRVVSLACLVSLPACNGGGSAPSAGEARPGVRSANGCGALPDADALRRWLKEAPAQGEAGGFASGRLEWAAIVDRSGALCAIATGSDDVTAPWPGAQSIAKAKAFTANAFSSDTAPMSTARLYTMSLPGHSLWGAASASPFNPKCFNAPQDAGGVGEACGGLITFGGGVPLYDGRTRVGALGVSGDTPCADHEIAKRIRSAMKRDPAEGPGADDIVYAETDGASIYAHPLCPNTWRNGQHVGDEPATKPPEAAAGQ